MTGDGSLAIVIQLLAGVALAACCGLRAFLPPFVVGLAVRVGIAEVALGRPIVLHESFAWIASTPALVVFGAAVVAEVLADKIPVIDHVLDTVQSIVRPVAGTLVVAASLEGLDLLPATVIGLIVGGTAAGSVHVAKAQTRVLSTASTAGLANPILSLAEDGIALLGSIAAVTAAILAAAVLLLLTGLVWRTLRRRRRRSSRVGA